MLAANSAKRNAPVPSNIEILPPGADRDTGQGILTCLTAPVLGWLPKICGRGSYACQLALITEVKFRFLALAIGQVSPS